MAYDFSNSQWAPVVGGGRANAGLLSTMLDFAGKQHGMSGQQLLDAPVDQQSNILQNYQDTHVAQNNDILGIDPAFWAVLATMAGNPMMDSLMPAASGFIDPTVSDGSAALFNAGTDAASSNSGLLDQVMNYGNNSNNLLTQAGNVQTADIGANGIMGADPWAGWQGFEPLGNAETVAGNTIANAAGGGGGMSAGDISAMTGGLPEAYTGGSTGVASNLTGIGGGLGPTSASAVAGGIGGTGGNSALTLSELFKNPSLDNFKKLFTGADGTVNMGGLLAQGVAGLISGQTNNTAAGQVQSAADKASALADPFASQRPAYQGELLRMFTDPNYFNNNANLKGINNNAINDTSRAMAAQGYNMSGNVPFAVGQRLQNNNANYSKDLMSLTANLAGANVQPSGVANAQMTGGQAGAAATLQNGGTWGNMLSNLFGNSKGGTGTGQQQSLSQFLFG